jgi:ribosomal protein L29
MLESKLEIQTSTAEELRSALEKLRRESVNERRQRAMSAFNVAENIAVEREGAKKNSITRLLTGLFKKKDVINLC